MIAERMLCCVELSNAIKSKSTKEVAEGETMRDISRVVHLLEQLGADCYLKNTSEVEER
jgi:hypothetical protein